MLKRILIIICLILSLSASVKSEYYAVLITGDDPETGASMGNDLIDRFWNDTFLMWECLWKHGWKNENIFVLFAGGEDWGMDNPRYNAVQYQAGWGIYNIVDDSCYYDDVEETLNYFDYEMTNDDFLLVWILCHGDWYYSQGDSSSIQLYGDDEIFAEEMVGMMPWPYDKRILWLNQCHSTTFGDNFYNNKTLVIAAADTNESAWEADNNEPDAADSLENDYYQFSVDSIQYYHHMELNYHAFNALMLETIGEFNPCSTQVDSNSDNLASITEIFNWSSSQHSTEETPTYYNPNNIGDEIFLNIPPYPPQNLDYTLDENNHPVLEWDLNTEYDIDQYKVYRQFKDPYQSYPIVNIATLDHPTHTYTDYEVVSNPELQSGAFYQVTALDEAGSESDKSNRVSLRTYVPNSEDEVTAIASSYLENFGI